MRGAKVDTGNMFLYLSPEQRVTLDHPLRAIRMIEDRSLAALNGHFDSTYPDLGRPPFRCNTCLCLGTSPYGLVPFG